MKKVQISTDATAGIVGYDQIVVTPDQGISMDEYSDNSCDSIFAPDILDSYSIQNHQPLIGRMVKKLRRGGSIVIGGTNISSFCKTFINGVMSEQDSSAIISKATSMTRPDSAEKIIRGLGLEIVTISLDGLHFELKAKRG
jgi:hypothetical protein